MRYLVPLAGLLSSAAPVSAQVSAAPRATARATLLKDSAFSRVRDLDFGTLIRTSLSANRTVSLSRSGVLTCAPEIVCSGTTQTARFRIRGPLNLVALVRTQNSQLTNGFETIAFTPDAPTVVVQTNLPSTGTEFDVGGSIVLTPQSSDGRYSGEVLVTVDYL